MTLAPAKVLGFLAATYLVNHVAGRLGAYAAWPDFDVPMHLIGGFGAGMMGVLLHERLTTPAHRRGLPRSYHALFVLGVVMVIAVAWEFHEYVLDAFNAGRPDWQRMQVSIQDTMGDLLNGMIGGAGAFWLFTRKP